MAGTEVRAGFALCICTYKRPHLVARLIADILKQSVQPEALVIVDGDPESGDVAQMLRNLEVPGSLCIAYIPSNHGNLAYQRYLGWRQVCIWNSHTLLYLDDDLRIEQVDAVENTLRPFAWEDCRVVGVTGYIVFGDANARLSGSAVLQDRDSARSPTLTRFVSRMGASRTTKPGGLSPSGHRRAPAFCGQPYEPVEWLRGGVMAYRMEAMTQACFSDDLFALTHIHCGLGEDTFLSRRVGTQGEMRLAFNATYLHPHDDLPKSYPIKALRFGYASSYSRRLLNDAYRGFEPPRLSDRMALVKSYLGTAAINWCRALTGPRVHRFAFAWGYTLGALRGLLQRPTARALTPHIDWWGDAEAALQKTVIVHPGRDRICT